ncbi:Telomere repeats-binding bouquet formation protein 1 [Apodemus speciosus]|uniref:Telomere repeats-binding bouquet formation protein 1 n=1 Tax=Apodemus speciosus TaxID=105296 RepID=A0ABQ0F2M1_APOSI
MSDAGIFFREIGGLMFIMDLAKSSEHSMVKEAALYTLGSIAEENGNGQTLVREMGCIEILSQMFRVSLYSPGCPRTHCVDQAGLELRNPPAFASQVLGLKACATTAHVQNCFVSSGGLDVLSQVLVQLESDSHNTLSSAKLAVVVTKTMDACITDNSAAFALVLSKYHIVSTLLALLLHETLDSREKFSIILAIGHCTEDCEKNQYELLKNNGLPLMIQALTEFRNEDLNKAATYVLHNCKNITGKLSLGQNSCSENETELKDISEKETIGEHWKAAKEILCRIKQFEKGRKEEKQQNGQYKDTTPSMKVNIQTNLKSLCTDSIGGTRAEDKDTNQSRELCSYKPSELMSKACANENQLKTLKKNTNPVNPFYREKGQNKIVHKTTPSCAQNLNEEKTFDQKDSVSQSSGFSVLELYIDQAGLELRDPPDSAFQVLGLKDDHVLKHLTHTVKHRKQQVPETDPFTLCLEIIDKEVGFQATDSCSKMLKDRCPGCIKKLLNSRNFSKFLHSCAYQCDHHKVIMEAEDKYKDELRKGFICAKKILLTPCRRRQLSKESAASEELKIVHQKPDSKNLPGLEAQALNTSIPEAKERRPPVPDQRGLHKKRRIRKNFTKEEVNYLFHGKGRRAVDLAHKYHKLIKGPGCTPCD